MRMLWVFELDEKVSVIKFEDEIHRLHAMCQAMDRWVVELSRICRIRDVYLQVSLR